MPTVTEADTFRRKDRVVAAVAMPGIPEGTPGRVVMVAGLTWIRYWVRFENGVVRGSLARHKLARLDEWEAIKERRERGDEPADTGGDAVAAPDGDGGAPAAAGDGYRHAGVVVPQTLLERSKRRREALGA